MWVSNTATTAIMLPIGVGILAQNTIDRSKHKFGTALMLGIAWSASVGGIGTIIGTPPNGIAISILPQNGLQTISFLDWMKFGVPYVIIFIPVVWFIHLKLFPPGKDLRLNKEFLSSEKRNLGKLSYGELLFAIVFLTAVLLWVSNPF
jgi:sodium-dependent dicarboxylate transporter 2/3/5